MQVSLESGFCNKSKRCRDMDENQQFQRKKLNRCQDELLGGASTSGSGVGCYEFTYFAGSFGVNKMDNKIKECGAWSICAPEYDSSIDEMYLENKDDIVEEVQFFDPTTEDFNPSLLPMELELDFCTKSERCVEIDELEPKTIGNVVEGSYFDHQNKVEPQTKKLMESAFQPLPTHISTQNDTEYLSESLSCGFLIGMKLTISYVALNSDSCFAFLLISSKSLSLDVLFNTINHLTLFN